MMPILALVFCYFNDVNHWWWLCAGMLIAEWFHEENSK